MDANLGNGLSAKCVITPRLKCKSKKKELSQSLRGSKKKYVSKLIKNPQNPKGERYEYEMYYRELLISTRIIEGAKKKKYTPEWLDSRFAMIRQICEFDNVVNKDRKLDGCDLKNDENYLLLFSVNGGCKPGELEKGDTLSFKDKIGNLITGVVQTVNKDDYVVYVKQLNKTTIIKRESVIKSCGSLNKDSVLKDFLSNVKDVKMRFKYMLESLQFLHTLGIAHLDIKRDNIVCDSSGVIRFIDFGASLSLKDDNFFTEICKEMRNDKNKKFPKSFKEKLLEKIAVHTPGYVSPEFQLCSDILALKRLDAQYLYERIEEKGNVTLEKSDKDFLLTLVRHEKNLIIDMFCEQSTKLLLSDIFSLGTCFKKILKDSKINDKGLNELVSKMRNPIYTLRPTAKDCLNHKSLR
jgi:serine/threonine protein kinase